MSEIYDEDGGYDGATNAGEYADGATDGGLDILADDFGAQLGAHIRGAVEESLADSLGPIFASAGEEYEADYDESAPPMSDEDLAEFGDVVENVFNEAEHNFGAFDRGVALDAAAAALDELIQEGAEVEEATNAALDAGIAASILHGQGGRANEARLTAELARVAPGTDRHAVQELAGDVAQELMAQGVEVTDADVQQIIRRSAEALGGGPRWQGRLPSTDELVTAAHLANKADRVAAQIGTPPAPSAPVDAGAYPASFEALAARAAARGRS